MVKTTICSFWLQIVRLACFIIVGPTLFTGCVRDGFTDCLLNVDLHIRLQLDSENTRLSQEIENVKVYVFDDMELLDSIIEVDVADIIEGQPLKLKYWMSKPPTVVVWANFNGTEQFSSQAKGMSLSEMWVKMGGTMDNALPTGALFYGIRHLNDDLVQEVVATSHVGRISITARGFQNLPEVAPDLFFALSTLYNGYDFNAVPLKEDVIVTSNGVISGDGYDYVTPEPVNLTLFPTDYWGIVAVRVQLRRKTDTGSVLMVEAVTDENGRRILQRPGRNTNVLLRVTEQGNVEVVIKVTEWDTIEQWAEW